MLISVIVAEKLCLRKCVCFSKVCHAWKTISCQTEMRNRVKHRQVWQGNCVEDGKEGQGEITVRMGSKEVKKRASE